MALRSVPPLVLVILAIAGCGGGAHHPHAAVTPPQPPPPPPPTVMNSAACRPPPQHPEPIALVHGTFATTSWSRIGSALARHGYCVFTFNYGERGTAEIAHSAHQLAAFVDRLLARTHAQRVSIVGHSEGGLMPRYYIRFLGGAGKVRDLVGLSPSNHGTENPMALVGAFMGCTACAEQVAIASPFLDRLNAGDETPEPVDYTVIQTVNDHVVVPYTSAFLSGPGARVTNITLQTRCARDGTDHLAIPSDPVALQWVENALGRAGPADPAFRPRCPHAGGQQPGQPAPPDVLASPPAVPQLPSGTGSGVIQGLDFPRQWEQRWDRQLERWDRRWQRWGRRWGRQSSGAGLKWPRRPF
jgi:triacylglycerol lipase